MNKYQRVITPSLLRDGERQPEVVVDVYDVCDAFPLEKSMSAIDHARKKLLAMGLRGHKDFKQDLVDVRDSINRAIEQLERDETSDEPATSTGMVCYNAECHNYRESSLQNCSAKSGGSVGACEQFQIVPERCITMCDIRK